MKTNIISQKKLNELPCTITIREKRLYARVHLRSVFLNSYLKTEEDKVSFLMERVLMHTEELIKDLEIECIGIDVFKVDVDDDSASVDIGIKQKEESVEEEDLHLFCRRLYMLIEDGVITFL